MARGRIVERGRPDHRASSSCAAFSSGAHGVLRREVDKLLDRGAEGIVLDLRGNGGGLLSEGCSCRALHRGRRDRVHAGAPRPERIRGRGRRHRRGHPRGRARGRRQRQRLGDRDRRTARPRESDRGRHNTFGKGLVQEVEPLSNGGHLDLTVANYYLPGGKTSTRGSSPRQGEDDPRHEPRRGSADGARQVAQDCSEPPPGGPARGSNSRSWPCWRSAGASSWPSRCSAAARRAVSGPRRAPTRAIWCWWARASAARA